MTITPTGAAPNAALAVAGLPDAGAADSGFADLVRQHLRSGADSSEECPGGLLTTEQAAALLEAASAPSAVPSEGLAALLAGLIAMSAATRADASAATSEGAAETDATAPAGIVATLPASGGTAPGAVPPDVIPATPGSASGVIGARPAAVAGPSGDTGQGVSLPTGPLAQVAQTQPIAQAARVTESAQATQSGQATVLLDGGSGEKAAAVPAPGDGSSGGSAAAAPTADGDVLTPVSSPASGAAAPVGVSVGTTGPTGSAEGPVSHPVTDQVFGQVTRLVSRGDGTHRLILRLHPADLGEVTVVLTVKDGAVDVSLSAGPAAREALRDGSPQLRALLEMAGATTAHVVVRDAAGNAVTTGAGGQQATGQQPTGAGTGDAHDQGDDPDLASRDGFADGSADGSSDGHGGADSGTASAAGLSGQGALAGVHVRPTIPSVTTGPVPTGIPARLDLNL